MSRPLVIIDDTDPSIQYSGPWFEVGYPEIAKFEVGGSLNMGIPLGDPFQSSLHGVNVTANFSFPFNGPSVYVYGTTITTNASGTQDPTWECFIDNISIGWFPAPSESQNNWILCGSNQLRDGHHLLTVKANVSNQQTFWFDQIQYAPSASVSLNDSLLRIDSSDPAIQYGNGWYPSLLTFSSPELSFNLTTANGNTSSTVTNGTVLTYQFSGTSIYSVGTRVRTEVPATYSFDDQDPFNFLSTANTTFYNSILFESGQLSPGQHKLVVKYIGSSDPVPINFNYFVQQNGSPSTSSNNTSTSTSNSPSPSISTGVPLAPGGSSSTSSESPRSTSSESPSFSTSTTTTIQKKATEAIISGVIGGFVLILLLLLLFINRRRIIRRFQAPSEKSYSVSSPYLVYPFTAPNSTFPSPPQNCTSSNDRSLSSQPISPSKSFQRVPREVNTRILLHEDSGVRIPSPEDEFVELPPLYTPG